MNVQQDYPRRLHEFIQNALAEDIGEGDHSALCCIDPKARGEAVLKIKDTGILAGVGVAAAIFPFKDPKIIITQILRDGQPIKNGDVAFTIEGNLHTILSCERLVLNCMQRMSGIATLTKRYTDKIRNYPAKLLDTRKTTPGFRLLEKEAVSIGGGFNHRFGLFDMIMLKDNHIDFCGGITQAVEKAWEYVQQNHLESDSYRMKIEVETRNLKEVQEVLKCGKADRIMLDNFTPGQILEALKMIDGSCETEASGGITLENIEGYAATGVDYISCGALIHQAQSLDMSLKAKIRK